MGRLYLTVCELISVAKPFVEYSQSAQEFLEKL